MAKRKTLPAGDLVHRVELQREVETQDPDTGEMTRDWQTYGAAWARVAPISVRNFIAAAADQSEVRAQITIRHRDDVQAEDRVLHRGLAYRVLGVLPDPESGLEYITLPVSEGVRVA